MRARGRLRLQWQHQQRDHDHALYVDNTTAQSSNKLLTSVMNALGHAATGIGIEPSCGPLPGFLA